MLKKLKERFTHVKNSPEFQEKLGEMKPKKSIWGFLLVILFFFVPEVINYIWGLQINDWIVNLVQNSPQTPMSDMLLWLSKKSFDGHLSFLNIGLGIAFMVWLFKD